MKASLATTLIIGGALLAGGCATKKYVRNTTAPIQAKVDQVGQQTGQNSQNIEDTRNQVKQVDERAQTGINAAQERAAAADSHAGEAMGRADRAQQSADKAQQASDANTQAIGGLRNVIANIDDYKLHSTVTVAFGFNKYALDEKSRQELDKVADDVKSGRRYFIGTACSLT